GNRLPKGFLTHVSPNRTFVIFFLSRFLFFPLLLCIPFFSPSPDPFHYLLPSPSISTRSPLPSPSLPPRLASSVTSRLLTTSQLKKTASLLMMTLLPQSFSSDFKLFVGNLPFNVDSAQVAQLFESAGNVEMAEVIYDKVTGRSRGFGFVTMSSASVVATGRSRGFCCKTGPDIAGIWTGGRLESLKLRLGLQGASFEHQSMDSYSLERYYSVGRY
ncbi:unnamed protein product, partial [Brassica oleracea]